jgi:immune inhibitor A
VDNNPHLYIVLGSALGSDLAGYFSSADEYHPDVHKYSNAHEMFLLNSDNITLSDEFTYGVLAHEFQHMIHWYRDLNEETWLNEGFSELAALLNGYDVGGFDQAYIMNPDLQLTDWAGDVGDNTAHYGASFLFVSYFLDRFGEEATKSLVALPENGMVSITKVLSDLDEVDPITGKTITSDDVFSDWVVTNYLNDPNVGDGRYQYKKYTNFMTTSPTEVIDTCPADERTTTVNQFGADYIKIECTGTHTFTFTGQSIVQMLNVQPNSGQYAYWSNKGDESDMTLTREFDFTNVSGPLTLNYSTWYDLEQDYDYVYVEVSEDGQNWTILHTPNGTDKDISGNSFGWGYNGTSDGWLDESVDISAYAGKKAKIRFEYVTDAAVYGEGMLVDDIRIPEIQYKEDFESGVGGWESSGFVRMNNMLPQTYRINLLTINQNKVTITPVTLDADNHAEISMKVKNGQSAVISISGVTPYTRQPAIYSYTIK